ncbi:MAG: hypothetical protein ACYCY6_02510 [Minisyncoccota bacterium]
MSIIPSQKSKLELELEANWSIADKWFRIIECAIILGALAFFSDNIDTKIGKFTFSLIYNISAVIIWGPLTDLCMLITNELARGRNKKTRITIGVVIFGFALGFWVLILNLTSVIAETQFK